MEHDEPIAGKIPQRSGARADEALWAARTPWPCRRCKKITVNIGLGEASQNVKLLDVAAIELGQIAGQKPVITRAKKSIANFKIRKGMPIGCCVTLARRPDVRISRPAVQRGSAARARLPRPAARTRLTAAAITRWA